jgi:DNA-binding transcriptional LysR family regulator
MAEFDWDHLRSFISVARCGRLTAAAARMGSDHTTLSRRITCLEHALQTKLFERSPAGYTLTEQGIHLMALAEQMETLSILAADTVGGSSGAIEGVVRIAGPEGFGSYFLAPRLSKLSDQHPGLSVQLLAGPTVYSLSKREADIVIALSRPADGRVVARKLIDYDLRLYASRSYLEGASPIASNEDLQSHHFIGYIGDLIQMPELDYISHVSSGVVTRLESSNLLVQVKAATAGAGICVLPAFIADCEPELLAVLPDEIQLSRAFWMIIHEDHKDRARLKIASHFIADEVRKAKQLFRHQPRKEVPGSAAPTLQDSPPVGHRHGRIAQAEEPVGGCSRAFSDVGPRQPVTILR